MVNGINIFLIVSCLQLQQEVKKITLRTFNIYIFMYTYMYTNILILLTIILTQILILMSIVHVDSVCVTSNDL